MKMIPLLLATFCLSIPSGLGDIVSPSGVCITSVVRLLAAPEQYEGKRVQVRGYYISGPELSGLFLVKESAETADLASGIWLQIDEPRETRLQIKPIKNGYVTVVGVFHHDPKQGVGHLGAWPGSLSRIEIFVPIEKTNLKEDRN